METWTITNIGPRTWKATRTFGPYTVAVGQGAYGGSWRIITATTILVQVDQLPTKSIDEAISVATSQISALIDALAPFSALAAELAQAEAVIESNRELINAAHAALARQAARIEVLEAKTEADADADTETARRLKRYIRRAEMAVMGPEDAEEGGQ
jgi:hypothetical protein